MPRRLNRHQAQLLFNNLNLTKAVLSPHAPQKVEEITGLCACCTYQNRGTPTYSRHIAAKATTTYSRGESSAARYLCVRCAKDLSVLRPELWDYARSALLTYRVIARQIREENRDFVQAALIVFEPIEKPVTANTRGKGKPKDGKQISIFELLEMQCTRQ